MNGPLVLRLGLAVRLPHNFSHKVTSEATESLDRNFNLGKLQELRQLVEKLPFVISDLRGSPCIQPIPETGETFIENASLKAAGYATQTGLLTLADDSGLEVDHLKGAPGVFSARYAHEGASDADRTTKLLAELRMCRKVTGRHGSYPS